MAMTNDEGSVPIQRAARKYPFATIWLCFWTAFIGVLLLVQTVRGH